MKFTNLKTAAFATAIAISFTGCDFLGGGDCPNPSGDVLTETVVVDEFTSINAVVLGTVFVSEGTEQEVRVEGEQQVLDQMDIQVVNGELKVDINACFMGSLTYNIYVTIPEGRKLNGVTASGQADLETTMPIEVAENFTIDAFDAGGIFFEGENENESLVLDIADAGTAEVIFRTNDMGVSISGSGDAEISGGTKSLSTSISDAGELHAFDLDADSAILSVSGSGDAEVTITGDDLEVDISGSGSVYYKGTPSNIQSRISGAGELMDAN